MRTRLIFDDHLTIVTMSHALERSGASDGAQRSGALAQPLVEYVAVDHSNEAALDRHVNAAVRGRYHSCSGRPCDQELIGNFEFLNQARRDCAAARLDPTGTIEQQDRAAARCQVGRGRRARRATPDYDHIICIETGHCIYCRLAPTALRLATCGSSDRVPVDCGWHARPASMAETRKSAASAANTVA
jgi:hypothetical protein